MDGQHSSFVVQVGDRVDDVVDELVWRTVESVKDKTRAARVLGIGRRTVYKHLEHRDGHPRPHGNGRARAVSTLAGSASRDQLPMNSAKSHYFQIRLGLT
jgi:hypothetical protein